MVVVLGCEVVVLLPGCDVVLDGPTSVVWGMPGFVARAGLAERVLPLDQIAGEVVRRVRPSAIDFPRQSGFLFQHEQRIGREEIEQGLPSLAKLPTALIWGMRDWCFTPHFLDRFQEFYPAADVHRMADAGHWVMEDAAEHVIPIIEQFVSRSER